MKKNKFKTFIKGKLVDFVIIDENFVKNTDWFDWINHTYNTQFMTEGNYPNTKSHQMKYFKDEILSNKRIQFGVVLKANNELIGIMGLHRINLTNRDAFLTTFFNKKNKIPNSLKVFYETHNIMINYGFKKLNLRRIISTTISKELDKLICKVLKFKSEGVMKKKFFKNNKYHDLYISSVFKGN